MSFRLGSRSRHRLEGLPSHLVQIVEHAITLSDIDFTVLEGLRSTRRQRQLAHQGASQTLRSRHLPGHAVDLGAWVGDELRWDWPLYHRIAEAIPPGPTHSPAK
ncbi:hypothetical protein [Grimontia marina]|uniref:Peptidase M15C domain-containing protein n=1 Tax=Grimontia marina TaxID=646534 RepID=A0A128FGK3_9GAMM|nr:hypothetical protein [Grimontia marina]CZF85932.1 hypothetical protein GMA8713_03965 [Grimontia marina]